MPMTATQAQQLYVAYFNRPADTLGLAFWMTKDAASASASFAASAEYAATYAGMGTAARVDAIYMNLFGRPAEPAGLIYWGTEIEAGRITIAQAVTAIAAGARTTDLDAYNNKVTAASAFTTALDTSAEIIAYSGTAANNAAKAWLSGVTNTATLTAATAPTALNATVASVTAASAGGAEGVVLALTTGTDAFSTAASAATSKTSAGSDTINGVVQDGGATGTTIAPGDSIDGGSGTDTLNISAAGAIAGGAAFTLSAIQTNSVEKVLLSNFETSTNETIVAADLMTGLQTVGLASSSATGDTTFSGLKNLVGAEMRNGSADLTLTYNASVVSGTADTQNLTVSNLSAGTFTANGAETIAITSELVKSSVSVASDTLKTVTAAGASDLTISNALTATTVDASAMTGALSVKLGAAVQTITGGKGNDTFDFQSSANLTNADTVKGGDGNDTLKLSVAGGTTVAVGTSDAKLDLFNVSGVEVIDIAATGTGTATLNLSNTVGVTNVVAAANVKTIVLDAAAADTAKNTNSVAIGFTLNGVAYTTAAADGSATSGEAAALLVAKINTITGFSAVVTTEATITITATTGEAVEFALTSGHTAEDSQGYNAVSFTNLAAGQVVDIFSADAVTAALKDASGTADSLSINLKTLSADKGFAHTVGTITASNIETINLSANGMTDTIKTTVAALTASTLKTLNITGDSDVTISSFTGSDEIVTIDGSTASGDLNLAAASAAKDQNIKTGSGNDTIVMGARLTAKDTIDGGGNNTATGATKVGVDTLTATGNIGTSTTAAALKITNVETIEVATGGAAATYIDAAGIVGATSLAFSATSGTVKLTNLVSSTKVGLGEGTTAFTGATLDLALADASGSADAISLTTISGVDAAATVTLKVDSAVETLNIAATTSAANARTATFTMTDMAAKNVVITAGDASDTVALGTLNAATTNVDASAFAGILTATTAATGAVTLSAKGGLVHNIVAGAGADTITISGAAAAAAMTINGNAGTDTLNVSLDNAASDFTNVSAIETINITVAGNKQAGFTGANADDGLNAATTVNILGGDSLSTFTLGTNAALDDDAAGTTFKLDASTFGGKLSNIAVAANAFDAELSILGGASTSDKVTAIISNATDNKIALMSGIETLVFQSIDNTAAATADLSNVTGLSTVGVEFQGAGNAEVITISKLAAGVKVTSSSLNTADNLVVSLASVSGTADALTLETTYGTAGHALNFDAAGIETLTIATKGTAAGNLDLGGVTATTGSNTTVAISGSLATTFNVLSTSINTITASGTGAITVGAAARANTAMTITGGEGDDSIAMENAGDVLAGGLGTDTLVVSVAAILGGIEVNLGATDQVVTLNGSSNTAAQSGFERVDLSAFTGFGAVVTGSTGANVIVGTALADQITSGNGADTITGGAGNDQIDLTETTAATDTVIVQTTTALNGSDTITGFAGADIIDFAFGDGGLANLAALRGAGTTYAELATAATIGTDIGFVNYTTTVADLASATILTAANTLQIGGAGSSFGSGDIIYFAASNNTDSAIYRLVENTGAGSALDTAELIVTLTGVNTAALTGLAVANFVDFV
jgi:hypothetical protein